MTFIEKLIQEEPEYYNELSEFDQEHCLFGCPCTHGFEKDPRCPEAAELDLDKYKTSCIACWHREIPEEKPEDQIDLTMKGEKKTMKLANVIRDAVLNAICDSDIEEAVKEAFSNYDYSDMISTAVEDYLHYNIEDIAQATVAEAVSEYMAENL